jgi:transcriptional regulator with XRE-family HTH domain
MKTSSIVRGPDMLGRFGLEKPGAYTGMNANTFQNPADTLGGFLRDRRSRLQPGPGAGGRRRTPGLRREEVATRAGVSVTWYTWLEQGRGGPPSADALERIARALELDADGRELLFLLAQQRPPPLSLSPARPALVSPTIQRVLDAMTTSPALVKTVTWDIVAWNGAARAVLGDGATPSEHNSLRRLFGDPAMRERLPDWEENVRFVLGVFRIDVARMGGSAEAAALAEELQATSADFRRLWAETDARSHGIGLKRFNHPVVGPFALEYSAFGIDGAEGLTMIVFTPVTAVDVRAVEALIARDKGQAAPMAAE